MTSAWLDLPADAVATPTRASVEPRLPPSSGPLLPYLDDTGERRALRTGDLFASGTVSGPGRDQRGSFIELSWGGKEPVTLSDGSSRTFLEDGDHVTLTATAPGACGGRISLGEVTGRVEPAR